MASANNMKFGRKLLGPLSVVWALVACTATPHVPKSDFNDAWGDRGDQVFARDALWCSEAIESRRSHWNRCMRERGWRSQP